MLKLLGNYKHKNILLVESCKLQNNYYICIMKVDISNLLTIKNFAKKMDVTPAYIYKLIKQGRMQAVTINDVQFINVKVYTDIPVMNRRK